MAAAASGPAQGAALACSGYGTVGVAVSDRDFAYQGIDRQGTLRRDSLLAAQCDAQFTPRWSATVQMRLAPSVRHDSRWDLRPNWAFVAWRPDNQWLLRVGRLRGPLYLYSEAIDIGQASDMARLPAEVYSLSQTTDLDGAALSTTWPLGPGDLAAEAYHGQADQVERRWYRDGLPGAVPPGARFDTFRIRISGIALTLRQPRQLVRLGLHQAQVRGRSPFPVRYPSATWVNGQAYHQTDDAVPGPGVPTVPDAGLLIVSLGAEQQFGDGWRLSAEYTRSSQQRTELGPASHGGFVALSRRIGRATPYLSAGRLRSAAITRSWYRRLTDSPLQDGSDAAALVNATQRIAAEALRLADQDTVALGVAFTLHDNARLKAEWAHTRIGIASRLVDTPPGRETPSHTSLGVLSLNLSFSF